MGIPFSPSHTSALAVLPHHTKSLGVRALCTESTFTASRSEHHDPELGSLHYSFCPSVSVEFFENRGDVKFNGVEWNPQPTRNCFVGGTICRRREHFKFAGRQLRIPVIACVEWRRWLRPRPAAPRPQTRGSAKVLACRDRAPVRRQSGAYRFQLRMVQVRR